MEANTIQALSQKVKPGATGLHWFNGDETIEVTTSDSKLMTKIRRLAKVNPDVVIDQSPTKENGGFMLALISYECLKLGNKRHLPEALKKCSI